MQFILNDNVIQTNLPTGYLLLDFIRNDQLLKGTKIGCREGDCGACTVLIGELINGKLTYSNVTSCLTPIGNVTGRHVVTIEGLNMHELSPVQDAIVKEGGTQCGFCTVGFIVSLTNYCLTNASITYEGAISSIDGNICRCTGYKSIERAVERIIEALQDRNKMDVIDWLVTHKFIPTYFREIPEKLAKLSPKVSENHDAYSVGGGTDLYVQRPDHLVEQSVSNLILNNNLKGVKLEGNQCIIGAQTTVTEFMDAEEIQSMFPRLYSHMKLVSSTPIRNIASIAGNFVNASPIGDMTAFFIALNTQIVLQSKTGGGERTIALKDLFKDYKVIDKKEDEVIATLSFEKPHSDTHFNFEKVSKRTYLDIASVNSAISITVFENRIKDVYLSAGGVAPIPKFLEQTCDWLKEKPLNSQTITGASKVMLEEINPISDIRGSAAYKRLLLKQLFYSHFITLFSDKFSMETIN